MVFPVQKDIVSALKGKKDLPYSMDLLNVPLLARDDISRISTVLSRMEKQRLTSRSEASRFKAASLSYVRARARWIDGPDLNREVTEADIEEHTYQMLTDHQRRKGD